MDILSQLISGRMPDIRDVVTVRAAIMHGSKLFQPQNLRAQLQLNQELEVSCMIKGKCTCAVRIWQQAIVTKARCRLHNTCAASADHLHPLPLCACRMMW